MKIEIELQSYIGPPIQVHWTVKRTDGCSALIAMGRSATLDGALSVAALDLLMRLHSREYKQAITPAEVADIPF